MLHSRILGRLRGAPALAHLGTHALLEGSGHQEECLRALGGASDRVTVVEVALAEMRTRRAERPGRSGAEPARQGAHLVTSVQQQPGDGATLLTGRAGDEDGDGLRHDDLPRGTLAA